MPKKHVLHTENRKIYWSELGTQNVWSGILEYKVRRSLSPCMCPKNYKGDSFLTRNLL